MTKGKPWSVEEEKQLREMVQEHKRLSEIAGFFGKSPASVKMKISRLKLVVVVRQIHTTTTTNKQRKKRILFCSCLARVLCPRAHCTLMITSLIRDETNHRPRAIGPKQVRKMIHQLYVQADLIKQQNGRMYDLRVHSLRKYFKTQLLALGVQPDYVDYMMGHTVDTYHDIQSIGIDKLRNVYEASGLAIRRKTQVNKIEAIKEIIRAYGMNPEQILTRDALNDGAITYKTADDCENHQLQILSQQLKQLIQKEASV